MSGCLQYALYCPFSVAIFACWVLVTVAYPTPNLERPPAVAAQVNSMWLAIHHQMMTVSCKMCHAQGIWHIGDVCHLNYTVCVYFWAHCLFDLIRIHTCICNWSPLQLIPPQTYKRRALRMSPHHLMLDTENLQCTRTIQEFPDLLLKDLDLIYDCNVWTLVHLETSAAIVVSHALVSTLYHCILVRLYSEWYIYMKVCCVLHIPCARVYKPHSRSQMVHQETEHQIVICNSIVPSIPTTTQGRYCPWGSTYEYLY